MDLAAAVLSFQERNMIRRIVICSSYLPYDAPELPPNRELEDLVNFCKTKRWDLVGCDSISHHSVSGSSDVNPRGGSILEYLMTIELQLLNRVSQPTFMNNVREEVIDITLCTSNIGHKIKGWRVSGETSLSDHYHILFTQSEEARQAIAYRDPNATNWDLYRGELKRDIEVAVDAPKIQKQTNKHRHVLLKLRSPLLFRPPPLRLGNRFSYLFSAPVSPPPPPSTLASDKTRTSPSPRRLPSENFINIPVPPFPRSGSPPASPPESVPLSGPPANPTRAYCAQSVSQVDASFAVPGPSTPQTENPNRTFTFTRKKINPTQTGPNKKMGIILQSLPDTPACVRTSSR
ncbi:hypothetical protein J437_LFUL018406 [Ladona fulva]|uniref:Endonuclease/exonuclease/phosphatase domain-containing protein n=1 Tax=Ladona fulva TaxID=123851 RepID=A0A8K0KNY4_LADFU|nr:hypothetical protein J437_LFUL018406 [Ladona fulva]